MNTDLIIILKTVKVLKVFVVQKVSKLTCFSFVVIVIFQQEKLFEEIKTVNANLLKLLVADLLKSFDMVVPSLMKIKIGCC